MVTIILGLDLLFWIAVLLTIVFFIDLSTCWWYNSLNWGPLKKFRNTLVKYHKYTRCSLIILIIIHIVLHILFQVFGIGIQIKQKQGEINKFYCYNHSYNGFIIVIPYFSQSLKNKGHLESAFFQIILILFQK